MNTPSTLDNPTRVRGPLLDLPLDRIATDPDQPRAEHDHESLDRLAQSLRTRGQLQPALVRRAPDDPDRFILVCGERRYLAAQRAGLRSLSCVVAEGPFEPDDLLCDQLVENALREDLSPIDQAHAFRRLIRLNDWTHRQLAEALSLSHQSVTRSLALLDLPPPIQVDLERGRVSPSTAYEISKLDDPNRQLELAALVSNRGFTRDEIAAEVAERRSRRSSRPSSGSRPVSDHWSHIPVLGGRVAVLLDDPEPETADLIDALNDAIDHLEDGVNAEDDDIDDA